MELIILDDGVFSLVKVTKNMLDHLKIVADVDCFSLCDIVRLELTKYSEVAIFMGVFVDNIWYLI